MARLRHLPAHELVDELGALYIALAVDGDPRVSTADRFERLASELARRTRRGVASRCVCERCFRYTAQGLEGAPAAL